VRVEDVWLRYDRRAPWVLREVTLSLSAQDGRPDWAERFHLTPYLGVRLPSLSKGTAQKVGLTQALLIRPDLLVLDEPTEGLDAAVLADLPLVITEVTAAGGAVVVSDHSGKLVDLPGSSTIGCGDESAWTGRGGARFGGRPALA
jgi:ABC-type branched-subunit amino acid transport system ATPase component